VDDLSLVRDHTVLSVVVESQFRKLGGDLRTRGEPRWKHVMHLLRLLISGRHLLEHGEPLVDVAEHRERLLAVRRGEVPWERVDAWRASLTRDLDAALTGSALPEEPDRTRVEEFLGCRYVGGTSDDPRAAALRRAGAARFRRTGPTRSTSAC
jgi:hypothetical protein